MKILKYIFFLIIVLSVSKDNLCFSQTFADKEYYLVDSLVLEELTKTDREVLESSLKLYHKAKNDTSKIMALVGVCNNMVDDNWTKYQFLQHSIVVSALDKQPTDKLRQRLLSFLAGTLSNIAYIYEHRGNISKALIYNYKALKINEEIGATGGVAISLGNLGTIYNTQGDIPKALSFYHKALKIQEKINNKKGIAILLNNLAVIYSNQEDLTKALEYHHKSLKISRELGNKQGIALSLENIGSICIEQHNDEKALSFYHQALKINEEIGDKEGLSSSLNAIGSIYLNQGDTIKALAQYYKSLKIQEKIETKNGIVLSLNNIGGIKLAKGNIQEAKNYITRSLKIAQERGAPDNIKQAAKLLSEIYLKQNKGIQALEMYKLYTIMKDSISNEKTLKASIQQQARYKYEQQKSIDDIKHDKQLAIEKEKKAKQKILTIAVGIGLVLVVVFLLFVFNRLRITKRQKLVIEEQKIVMEEKNQEIMDSITYAKRIQSAILPTNSTVKKYLPESFILYKPKDIIAGDFYWVEPFSATEENKSRNVLFAAADCTGHGVPGAMVSVVCNNALNHSVRNNNLIEPGKILDRTREIVIQEFEKSDEDVRDGMDIALCSLAFSSPKEKEEKIQLKYAGANNPLWVIRKKSKDKEEQPFKDIKLKTFEFEESDFELHEIKANKQPIGKFDNPKPYVTHTLELRKGDTFYIFSDGYVDQFGGKKGKKMKAKLFRQLLLSIQEKSMAVQKNIINETFEIWKGKLEQIDDVCIIGVSV